MNEAQSKARIRRHAVVFAMVTVVLVAGLVWMAQADPPLLRDVEFAKAGAETVISPRSARLYVCARVQEAPSIDGKLNDECWSSAQAAGGFSVLKGGGLAKYQTVVRLGFDSKYLYLGYECHDEEPPAMKSTVTGRDDSKTWTDDCVEIFLQPNPPLGPVYQWIVNCAGATLDMKNTPSPGGAVKKEMGWNSEVEAVSKAEKDRWIMEARILLTSLGLSESLEGATWGANFTRNRASTKEASNWAGLSGTKGHMEPERFGQLVFGGATLFIEELDSGGGRLGLNEARVKLRTRSKSPAPADMELIVNGAPASRSHAIAPAQGTVPVTLPYVLGKPGPAWVEAQALDPSNHAKLAAARAEFVVPEAVDIRLSGNEFASSAKDAQVEIHVMLGQGTLRRTRLNLKLLDSQGRVARKITVGHIESERVTGRLDLSRLGEGGYTLVCEAVETPNLKRGEAAKELTVRQSRGDVDGFDVLRRPSGKARTPETPPAPPAPAPAQKPAAKPAKTPKPANPGKPAAPAAPAQPAGPGV